MGGPPASQGGAGGAPPGLETYVVTSKAPDTGEVVVRTLIGEFTECGANHGRKVFKKLPDKGAEAVDVFLYYWDARDGPTFEGWWFGNKLGGTQVWSHNASAAMTPPQSGWKIPWDGAPRPTLVVENKALMQRAAGLEKLSATSRLVQEAGFNARAALEKAKAAHQNTYTSAEGLKVAEGLLAPQVLSLAEALKRVTEEQRTASGEAGRQFAQLGTALRSAQQQVAGELGKIRTSKVKAEQDGKTKAAEARDQKAFQDMLPECQERSNTSEDLVDKAIITSEMIQAAGEDLPEAKRAVDETETAVKVAQDSISATRVFLNQKNIAVRKFETPTARDASIAEINKFHAQLLQAQNKLNPLKTVKQDFMQRETAQRCVAEVMEKLTPAEIECDKAEEGTLLLSEGGSTKDMMVQADMAVTKAMGLVQAVLKLILARKPVATGLVLTEVKKLEERARAAEKRLQQLKNSQKEATEKVSCESLIKEAGDKLQIVQDAVSKVSNAEGPFLMGVEELPIQETLVAVKACETAATSANTAVSIARMFIATKLVEAKRFTAAASQEAIGRLKEYQKQLESHSKRLTDIKTNTCTRKKKAFLREAEAHVVEAEATVKAMATAAARFDEGNAAKLAELPAEELRAAGEEASKAEAAANAKLAEARKYIHARQIEAKGKDIGDDVGPELAKYNARISAGQGEVAKCKKLVGGFGERLQALKALEEVAGKVAAAEAKADEACGKVEALEDGAKKAEGEGQTADPAETAEPSFEAVKTAEAAVNEANTELRKLHGHLTGVSARFASAREDVGKLQERVAASTGKLAAAQGVLKMRTEQAEVQKLLSETEAKCKDAEALVHAAQEAEAPFLTGEECPAPAQAAKAFEALEASERAAHVAVGAARTLVAMKKLACKRLAEASAAKGVEGLAKLQERVETANKKLSEIKANLSKRKHQIAKQEVEARMKEVNEFVKAAQEATEVLVLGGDMAPEAMKAACEKAGSTQAAAKKAIDATRQLLGQKQREARANASAEDIKAELIKMILAVDAAQGELDAQIGRLRDQEHKFVAQRLIKDATDHVEAVEKKLADTLAIAAPLVSEEGQGFSAFIWLAEIMSALKKHMSVAEKSQEDLFAMMSDKAETVPEAKFLSFLKTVPELKEEDATLFSDEELKAVFKHIDTEAKGEIKNQQLKEQFRLKFFIAAPVSMTDGLAVKGGKTIRKLELNEVIEALDEPQKEPNLGILRVKAKTEKDGKEGYITLKGNQGTDYLADYDPYLACEKKVQKSVQELLDASNAASRYIDKKSGELHGVAKGPLFETRELLMGLKPRISKVQQSQVELRSQVARARKKHQENVEAEKQRRQEAIDRRAARSVSEEAEACAKEADEDAKKASSAAEVLVASRGADAESPLQVFGDADKALLAAAEACEKAEEKIRDKLDGLRSYFRGPFAEARNAMKALKEGLGASGGKCRQQAAELKGVLTALEGDAHAAVLVALCAHLRKEGLSTEALFKQLAGGETSIPADGFRGFLEKMPGLELKKAQLDIGLARYSSGVSRLMIVGLLQLYLRCAKELAITSAFEVKESKTVRKLAVGEIVEVLEEERTDEAVGLVRAKVKALLDGDEGWATLRGNQGTTFLVDFPKPFYILDDEVQMQSGFQSTSSEIRRMRAGEVLELLEGPRREDSYEIFRARGRAAKDGKEGWLTFKDNQGKELFEKVSVYVCRQGIALTVAFDITEGKPVRKLEVGEAMEVIGEPVSDEKKGLSRIKVKTKVDEKEGWVTLKGNQGTAFVEESDKHFVCKVGVPLEMRFQSGSPLVRSLEVGEVFEVREGPKAEAKEGASRLRGRNLGDGTEGWFNGPSDVTVPWSPFFVCKQSTVLTDGLDIASARAVRKLEVGERLVALETPVVEPTSGLMRVRLRCDKDGSSGFASVWSQEGAALLEPLPTEG